MVQKSSQVKAKITVRLKTSMEDDGLASKRDTYSITHKDHINILNQCMLLVGFIQCDIVLFKSSNFTNENLIGCSDIIKECK